MTSENLAIAKVSVVQEGGEWLVNVRESDGELNAQTFAEFEWAMNYAEGQRMRLGLEQVDFTVPPEPDENRDDGQDRQGRAPIWAVRHAATDAASQAIIDQEIAAIREKTERLRKARLAGNVQARPPAPKQSPLG